MFAKKKQLSEYAGLVVGVLAIQGDFFEHSRTVEKLGAKAIEVRTRKELDSVDALIMPGGESSSMLILLEKHNMLAYLKKKIIAGLPVFATCAGVILLAENVDPVQKSLGCIDISVKRNGYGRQIDSFETTLDVLPKDGWAFTSHAVFIRAPVITKVNKKNVEVLASYGESDNSSMPVLVQQDNVLCATYHPELVDDSKVHKYFLDFVLKN